MLASCSKYGEGGAPTPDEGDKGGIRIMLVDAVTRASEMKEGRIELSEIIDGWSAPDWKTALAVQLACEDRSVELEEGSPYAEYPSVEEFNAISAGTELEQGRYAFTPAAYTVRLVSRGSDGRPAGHTDIWGDEIADEESIYLDDAVIAAEEGAGKPCFEGRTKGIVVKKRREARAEVTVKVANSAVKFVFSDNFRGYFPEAKLAMHTDSGYEMQFGYGADGFTEQTEYCWINPLGFRVEGTVRTQDPAPGVIEGRTHNIAITVPAGDINPRTVYTYRFDAEGVGGTENNGDGYDGIKIILDTEPAGYIDFEDDDSPDFELNPDVDPK